jgi:hypothetical protein
MKHKKRKKRKKQSLWQWFQNLLGNDYILPKPKKSKISLIKKK